MARTQTRTVTVLRAAPPRLLPIARRLFAVAGLVLAGWLLGSSGQASADTTTGPAVASATQALVEVAGLKPVHEPAGQWVDKLADKLADEARSATAGLPDQIADPVLDPVLDVVRDPVVPEVRRPVRPTVHHRPQQHPRGRGEAARKPVTAAASERHATVVKIHTVTKKRPAGGVPMPVQQRPSPLNLGAGSLPQAGGVVMGGWMATPLRAGSTVTRHPVLVLAPWIGALPPVVRTVADEPSLSPD
ncbi:MAG: hypothetical protein ABIS86_22525 [Streptosporangiaceae bacterium]